MKKNTFLIWLFLFSFPSFAFLKISEPKDFSKVEVSLLTIGRGPDIPDSWGHSILRFKDPLQRLDLSFNWGTYDFRDPWFLWNFFRGRLNYFLSVDDAQDTISFYTRFTDRGIKEQVFDLSISQKRQLFLELLNALQPDNRTYQYYYFFDNCATRPRDVIDRAIDGQLAKAFKDHQVLGLSFRDYVWSALSYWPFIAMSLDLLMNSNIDKKADGWEEMFLPERLFMGLEHLLVNSAENPNLQKLVKKSQVLREDPYFGHESGVNAYIIVLTLGLFFIAWRLLAQSFSRLQNKYFKFLEMAWWLVFWSVISAFGIVMAVSWGFSGHNDLFHNANLLVMWPTDFLMIFKNWQKKFLKAYFCSKLFFCGAFLVLSMLKVIQQNTVWVCLSFVTIMILYIVVELKCYPKNTPNRVL